MESRYNANFDPDVAGKNPDVINIFKRTIMSVANR